MANIRNRRSRKSKGRLLSRHNRGHKPVQINNQVIAAHWDRKATLRENYQRLGLMTSVNGVTGGVVGDLTVDSDDSEQLHDLRQVLASNYGIIKRDDEGNIIEVILPEPAEEDAEDITEVAPSQPKAAVAALLEEMARVPRITKTRFLPQHERACLQPLHAKYGQDYEAMARDIKLNAMQFTAYQLKKKFELY